MNKPYSKSNLLFLSKSASSTHLLSTVPYAMCMLLFLFSRLHNNNKNTYHVVDMQLQQ